MNHNLLPRGRQGKFFVIDWWNIIRFITMKTTGTLDFVKKTGILIDLDRFLTRAVKAPGFIPSNFRSRSTALDRT